MLRALRLGLDKRAGILGRGYPAHESRKKPEGARTLQAHCICRGIFGTEPIAVSESSLGSRERDGTMNRRSFLQAGMGVTAMSALRVSSPRNSSSAKTVDDSSGPTASKVRNLDELIDEYVAVWNEPDAAERRRRIESVWRDDGLTCSRAVSRGYDEIEKRVTGSWQAYLRDGNYIFKPRRSVCHHDVVRFEFVMVTVPHGQVADRGLSFLILDGNGRIQSDLQFNPTVNEAESFANRYLAVLREDNERVRRNRMIELWASDAVCVGEQAVTYGHTDLLNRLRDAQSAHVQKGSIFVSGKASQAHHNFVTFRWQIENRESRAMTRSGSELIILDENGRIRVDYQFLERI